MPLCGANRLVSEFDVLSDGLNGFLDVWPVGVAVDKKRPSRDAPPNN